MGWAKGQGHEGGRDGVGEVTRGQGEQMGRRTRRKGSLSHCSQKCLNAT